MNLVLRLASKGKGKTSPNPMVGAVVVKNQRIVAEGWHRKCGGDHAEKKSLDVAGKKAKGAKLFINLEPCHHHGRTPPCVDKIIESQIKEVVIGMKDPNPLTNGKSIAYLRRNGVKVQVGLLEDQCRELNEPFVKWIKKKMPFVVGKTAQTLDGKIATENGHSKWITAEKTRDYARKLRNEFDAICVGINTVIQDNPSLSAQSKTKSLVKIVVDSKLRVSVQAKLFKNSGANQCIIATTKYATKQGIARLEKRGVIVILCPLKNKKVDLKFLFKDLARRGIMHLLIEGGAEVLGCALKEQLVDKLHIYIAPKIIGSQNARNSIVGLNVKNVNQSIKLHNIQCQRIGEDFFIQGYVHRNRRRNW